MLLGLVKSECWRMRKGSLAANEHIFPCLGMQRLISFYISGRRAVDDVQNEMLRPILKNWRAKFYVLRGTAR